MVQHINREIKQAGKTYPKQVGQQKPAGRFTEFAEIIHGKDDAYPKQYNNYQRNQDLVQTKKQNGPRKIEQQLQKVNQSRFTI